MNRFGPDYAHLGADPATDNPKKDIDDYEAKFKKYRNNSTHREREWYINHSFLHGKQWISWNSLTNRVETTPVGGKKKQRRIVVNVFWQKIWTKWSRQTKMAPIVEVVPETDTLQDKEAARTGQIILDHFRKELKLDKKKRYIDFLEQLMATVFLKVFPSWDRRDTQKLPAIDESGSIKRDAEGDPVWIEYSRRKIMAEIRTGFDIAVDDSDATDMDTIKWIADLRLRDLDYIRDHYGVAVEAERDTRSARDFLDFIHSSNDSASTYFATSNENEQVKKALVKEFYEEPSARWPTGRILTIANGKLLQAVNGLSKKWWHPFVKFDLFKNPLRFWASTYSTHLINPQHRYNIQIMRIDDYIQKMTKGKWLIGKGSGIGEFVLNNTNGEFVEFNPTVGPPQQMALQPLPPHMFTYLQQILTEMDNIAGIHEPVSRGKMPANVKTLGQAMLLNEADDTRESPIFDSAKESWTEVYERILSIVEEFFPEENIEVPMEDNVTGEKELTDVNGKMVTGNLKVNIQIGTALPQSRMLRNNMLKEDWRMGLYGPPNDPKVRTKVLKRMEFGDLVGEFGEVSKEEPLLRWEHSRLLRGQMVPVKGYHDHAAHLDAHNGLLKSRGHHLNPAIEQIISQHVEQHGQVLKQLIEATAATYPGKGPSGPGGPPLQPPGMPGIPGPSGNPGQPPQGQPVLPSPIQAMGGGTIS